MSRLRLLARYFIIEKKEKVDHLESQVRMLFLG